MLLILNRCLFRTEMIGSEMKMRPNYRYIKILHQNRLAAERRSEPHLEAGNPSEEADNPPKAAFYLDVPVSIAVVLLAPVASVGTVSKSSKYAIWS